MFIHVGGDIVIRSKDIIAILDQHVKKDSEITEGFLNFHKAAKKIKEITKDMTKSIVITTEQIYFSPISSVTLKKRALFVSVIEDK